ncbi:MAG: hypothetical protein HOO06_05700 [Bdellovibrionaceae bacterium]|jgi:hypothetical protein|nr:hypothetical protein [Pseudobdellovibrionaceae bacterium]
MRIIFSLVFILFSITSNASQYFPECGEKAESYAKSIVSVGLVHKTGSEFLGNSMLYSKERELSFKVTIEGNSIWEVYVTKNDCLPLNLRLLERL